MPPRRRAQTTRRRGDRTAGPTAVALPGRPCVSPTTRQKELRPEIEAQLTVSPSSGTLSPVGPAGAAAARWGGGPDLLALSEKGEDTNELG